jgi:type IV secretory pathway VirB10-like protein
MSERRKIIIETGAVDEPLPTPHFDTEATLTARPVVPLSDQEIHQLPYGAYSGRAVARPFWKRPAMLALIVLVAVGIGVGAGLGIGLYRNRQTAQTPAATAPPSTAEDVNAGQTVEQPIPPQPTPAPQERAAVTTDEREAAPVAPKREEEPKVEERERTTTARNERKSDNDDEASRPVVAAAKPTVVRSKKPVKVDEYIIEDGREESRVEQEQRREERRAERRERRRRSREDEADIPRGIDRAGKEVNRIREIFEGRQP